MARTEVCVICGETATRERHTCVDHHCIAVLKIRPQMANARLSPHPHINPVKPPNQYDRLRRLVIERADDPVFDGRDRDWVLRLRIDTSDWAFGDEYLTADLRGLGGLDHREVWSKTSRVRVALRATTAPGEICLHLRRRVNESSAEAVRRDWFAGTNSDRLFDAFLAWRCRCAKGSEWTVLKLDDLPDAPGPHHSCPACGATPLLIEELQ